MASLSSSELAGRSAEYVRQTIARGLRPADDPFTERCRRWLEGHFEGARVWPTTSCTAALEAAAIVLGVGPGDEVIVPSYTFVATASAFALRGATLVFADSNPVTFGLDVDDALARITPRTRAVVAMHYGCAGDGLVRLAGACRERGVVLVEDAAHGLLATLGEQRLGTFGSLAATSFHHTKPVGCGQGGALIVNDADFVERASLVVHRGTDLVAFLEGRVEAYRWCEHGSSYHMSEIAAAHLLGQLESIEAIQVRRRAQWRRYVEALDGWAESAGFELLGSTGGDPPGCSSFPLLAPDRATRDALREHLARLGIDAPFHYVPLHRSPMAVRLGVGGAKLPVAERLANGVLRLPQHPTQSAGEQRAVIDGVRSFG